MDDYAVSATNVGTIFAKTTEKLPLWTIFSNCYPVYDCHCLSSGYIYTKIYSKYLNYCFLWVFTSLSRYCTDTFVCPVYLQLVNTFSFSSLEVFSNNFDACYGIHCVFCCIVSVLLYWASSVFSDLVILSLKSVGTSLKLFISVSNQTELLNQFLCIS